MTEAELWQKYANEFNIKDETYKAWSFGDDADLLGNLVLNGIKTATASAFPLYEAEREDLPSVGEISIILDSFDNALCIIKTTKVYVTPFLSVTKEHTYKEGEGDKTLEYWRKAHEKFFKMCLSEARLEFDNNMLVVCEEFEVIYK